MFPGMGSKLMNDDFNAASDLDVGVALEAIIDGLV